MKKSMLNVITLALVLINLVLTVLLTFSLVSTNITKVSQIIDLDVGGITADSTKTASSSIDDITYLDVTNNDSTDITVSYTDAGNKTHYVVLNVSIGLDSKAKDYETKKTTIQNGMKVIVSQVTTEALKYSYNEVTANKTAIEKNLLTYLQDQFQTDVIQSVTLTKILAS